MAIIDAKGLIKGDRLRLCSDMARLWWPYLFLQSNSFGRMELDYHQLVVRCGFKLPPSEEEFYAMVQEYRTNYLGFLYEAPNGTAWLQWWAKAGSLPRYNTAEDRRSPEPPIKEYERWQKSYVKKTKASCALFGSLAKSSQNPSEKFRLGVGVGVGVGEGVGVGAASSAAASIQDDAPPEIPSPPLSLTPTPPKKHPDANGLTPLASIPLPGNGIITPIKREQPPPPAPTIHPRAFAATRDMLIDWMHPCRLSRPPDEALCAKLLLLIGGDGAIHLQAFANWLKSLHGVKDPRSIQSWGWFVKLLMEEPPAREQSA